MAAPGHQAGVQQQSGVRGRLVYWPAWLHGVLLLLLLLLCLAGVQVACHKFSQHKFARPAQIANRLWVGRGAKGAGTSPKAGSMRLLSTQLGTWLQWICQVIKGIARVSTTLFHSLWGIIIWLSYNLATCSESWSKPEVGSIRSVIWVMWRCLDTAGCWR